MAGQETTPEGYAVALSGTADKQAGGPHHNAGQLLKGQVTGCPLTPEHVFDESEPPLTLGSCLLQIPAAARIVQDALLYFEGARYCLAAWCIMPNHAHVVLTPSDGHGLSEILQSWKSFTAKEINKALGKDTTVIFSTESEFFQFLKKPTEAEPATVGGAR